MTQLLKISMVTVVALFVVQAHAADHVVKMKSISFEPKVLVIKAGDAVTWVNESLTPHSATADTQMANDEKFDTGLIDPKKKSKQIIFKNAGAFAYHCALHGKTMSGRIEVQK